MAEKIVNGEGDVLKELPEGNKSEETHENPEEDDAEGDDKGEADKSKNRDAMPDIDPLLEGDEEEEVTIKRGTLKKVKNDLVNYKTVAMSKRKETKAVEKKPESPTPAVEDKFVTVKSVEKKNSRDAIDSTTIPLEADSADVKTLKKEINDNWPEIVKFYTARSGKDDPKKIADDIYDAHAAWKRRNGGGSKGDTTAAADLAASRGNGGRSPKTNQQNGERKRILPKSTGPKDWFPKKE